MHNLHRRPNDMLACKQAIMQIADSDTSNALVYDVPLTISRNLNWQ